MGPGEGRKGGHYKADHKGWLASGIGFEAWSGRGKRRELCCMFVIGVADQ
jgi:hypothetical protein